MRFLNSVLFLSICLGVFATPAAADEPSGDVSTVEFIDARLQQGYTDNEIKPSPRAEDSEWVRRVYLDLVGRIPSLSEAKAYIESDSPRKQSELIEALVGSPDYIRNFTTIWTNECIGRGTPRRVSRTGMEKFFREAFAKNRPWNEVVTDLITGEGHFEENGAVNYILAQMQMRDEGVQLTAKTARLFLGMQVQCTQCHNHPFNDWQQSQFWEFNSFFRQLDKRDHRKLDPNTGRQVDDYSEVVWKEFGGPVYFERRSGLMQVAMPKYMGKDVDPGIDTDRREALGKLICESIEDQPPQLAQAMVNRMWGHFFGYGFTRPVDDMGPHNPASHPELLTRLSRDFVESGYDVRQLARWICNSEAYQFTSRRTEDNAIDDPGAGEMPLFSRMYVKSMEAEQLYDSLITASSADQAGGGSWEDRKDQRRRWMQQFVVAFDNDENDESTTFNGTIPQALMMMNSELTGNAVSAAPGSLLHSVLANARNDSDAMSDLYLAALTRRPNRVEISKMQRLIGRYPANMRVAAYQDLFWALLNSNEFIFVH